jgi:hypothetical protein
MYVPCSFERVFRRDRPEHFMVVGVDFHHQIVSLVAIDGDDRELAEGVPFFELEPVDRVSLSEAGWDARRVDKIRRPADNRLG